jgi:hypothetical protein
MEEVDLFRSFGGAGGSDEKFVGHVTSFTFTCLMGFVLPLWLVFCKRLD